MTPEQHAMRLRQWGIDPDGYGQRPGETVAEHAARVQREAEAARPALLETCARLTGALDFDPLDFLPCQRLGLEEIDI